MFLLYAFSCCISYINMDWQCKTPKALMNDKCAVWFGFVHLLVRIAVMLMNPSEGNGRYMGWMACISLLTARRVTLMIAYLATSLAFPSDCGAFQKIPN
jgi:hypothetical protein